MTQRILTLNAGSSSLKFATFVTSKGGDPVLDLRGQLAGIGQGETRLSVTDEHGNRARWGSANRIASHADAVQLLIDRLQIAQQPDDWLGAGHRVVHGGERFTAATLIDAAAFKGIEYEGPAGHVKLTLGDGHQGVTETAYGTYRFNKQTKEPEVIDIVRYPAECVNPPPGVESEKWVADGMPGAKC